MIVILVDLLFSRVVLRRFSSHHPVLIRVISAVVCVSGVMVAKAVGDVFTHALYHALLEVKCVPFLDPAINLPKVTCFTASDVMAAPPVTIPRRVQVRKLVEILKTTRHNGFPVVVPTKKRCKYGHIGNRRKDSTLPYLEKRSSISGAVPAPVPEQSEQPDTGRLDSPRAASDHDDGDTSVQTSRRSSAESAVQNGNENGDGNGNGKDAVELAHPLARGGADGSAPLSPVLKRKRGKKLDPLDVSMPPSVASEPRQFKGLVLRKQLDLLLRFPKKPFFARKPRSGGYSRSMNGHQHMYIV